MASTKSKPKTGKDTTDVEEVERESIELVNNQDDVHNAEAVLNSRIKKGKVQYYVKWWGSSECTWEPEANILDPRLLKKFREQNQSKSKVKRLISKSKVTKRGLNAGVGRKNTKIRRPAENTKRVEERVKRKKFSKVEENLMPVNDKISNKIRVGRANNVKQFEKNSVNFDKDKNSNKIKVGRANNMNGFGESKRPVRLSLLKQAGKALEKNGKCTKTDVRKVEKMASGGEKKMSHINPQVINIKNNTEGFVEKKKIGRPPVVKDNMKPEVIKMKNAEGFVEKKKRGRPPVVKDKMKSAGNRCEDVRLLECAKLAKEGNCPSPVKVESMELGDEMDPPQQTRKMDKPKLLSEIESTKHDKKLESQGDTNEMDHNTTITIDETCEDVYESNVPELAKYWPSPATNHTHRLGYSSSGSDATSPNPVSRSHPPQESRSHPPQESRSHPPQEPLVTGVAGTSQAINRNLFNVAAGPVPNYSRVPQSLLTTAGPGNNTRVPQSLQPVAASSLVHNGRAPQTVPVLATSSLVQNVGTPQAAAATWATPTLGHNAQVPYHLVLPFYGGHLQDIGYQAPDDSPMHGNSLYFEDTFDYS